MHDTITNGVPLPEINDPRLRCGTLVYSRYTLSKLFVWLLWGDFCFMLMETVWPNVLPLVLKSLGAPNTILSLVITTIPGLMNLVMNPIISTASDRHRGKWGRRIPFMLFATPFITFFLVLLGFSKELSAVLYGVLKPWFPTLSPAITGIGLICCLIIAFRFFELFVGCVFWYLFNDVVPTSFIGRFLGFFRIVTLLSVAVFNFFIFKYAESHTAWIFFGAAVIYCTVFSLMCLNVKEGEYPPPDPITKNGSIFIAVRTFFVECFSHSIFRRVFAYCGVAAMVKATLIFQIFMAFSIGMTKEDFGIVAGVVAVIGMALMYPMGALVDRFHPLRIMLVAQGSFLAVSSLFVIFLFFEFPPRVAFWIYAGISIVTLPLSTANDAAGLPLLMRIFPHERYGQFCAANAIGTALSNVIGGVLAGVYLDVLSKWIYPGKYYFFLGRTVPSSDFYFRFIPLWNMLFMLLTWGMCYLIFREWKRLGGDSYKPPI